MFNIDEFERVVRIRLKTYTPVDKIYLKKNYVYEIFDKHNLQDSEIDLLFDMKRIIRIYPNLAFNDRIDAEINIAKNRKIKVIFIFDPVINGKIIQRKMGIITAFLIS
ncbi:MAG: hypothetical protein QT02_C0004G0066 [archaeon GW2011_AR9]|nr:MAG: hypothetical protein QT02_C0004G0066 [archaeon GW2011_AR9]